MVPRPAGGREALVEDEEVGIPVSEVELGGGTGSGCFDIEVVDVEVLGEGLAGAGGAGGAAGSDEVVFFQTKLNEFGMEDSPLLS